MPTLASVSIKDNSTWTTFLNMIYPVGSYYLSNSSTTPASKFGGTWTAITGRFLYCNAGTGTGGSNTHTLTVKELPSHSHSLNIGMLNYSSSNFERHTTSWSGQWSGDAWTNSSGDGKAHNNMPAYKTCYCWYRTA